MDSKRAVWTAVAWLASVFSAILAIAFIRDNGWLGAPLLILAGVVLAPPFRSFVARRYRLNVPGVVYGVAFVALGSIGLNVATEQHDRSEKAREQSARDAVRHRIREGQAAAERDFRAKREEILSEARRLSSAGDHSSVVKLLARFSNVADLDLLRLRDTSSLVLLRAELTQNPTVERQAHLYTEIAKLDPSDIEASKKSGELSTRVASERAFAELKKEREQQFRKQFSGFDGSHPAVERAIKNSMKNPASYEHVETVYYLNSPDVFIVRSTFRGTNSFNAVVTNVATASVSHTGELRSLTIN